MSYEAYKVLHLFGIVITFVALGGLVLRAMEKGTPERSGAQKLGGIFHGLGLLILLVSGFGLLARLNVSHGSMFPLWVWLKLGIWLLIGVLIAVIRRVPASRKPLWFILPLLGVLAAYIAIYKPS